MKGKLHSIVLAGNIFLGIYQSALAEDLSVQQPADLPDGNKLDVRKGLRVYKSACAECHATGKDGAPRLHDREAWKNRSFQSFALMEKHVKSGFLMMPPKGRRPTLGSQDIANAVFYMSQQIQAKGAE